MSANGMDDARRGSAEPLWRWISLRMIALALAAILAIGGGMWLRFCWWEAQMRAALPEPVRQELQRLEAQPAEHRQRLLQIYGEYMYGEYFTNEAVREDMLFFGVFVLLSIPPIVIGGVWVSLHLSRQLGAVASSADRIAQGDFTARAALVPRAPAALRSLTDDFNRMAERLERHERELRASSAAAAHELRTPLTAAKGRLQGLMDGVFAPTPQNFQLIMRQLDQLNRLIDDLYLLSLASARQLTLSPCEFALRPLLEERIAWAAPRLQALQMRADLDAAEDLYLRADRHRLGQTISILLDNAIRYAASGGWIALSARRQEEGVRIEVEDGGPGFAPEHLDRVCDRFWRAESSRSRHAGGSGLGLAVAAAICQAHAGRISVHNRDGGGARIVIYLPD
ncbi:ATP-binding protein [Brenneria populi subsp. brevivirga]|uniref:Signal transduction histidine-protein kinase/phosphatase MprB n=1 Tax=Brenneria populi TaxID=1505588 RepID=A0ABU6JUQ4_9GAMM|nr:ATP-binding protein [Brenneria populi subsp. brevivirga]MEC5344267.1 ATP-binding protein [Brenneria populi Li et al. 2015]